MSDQELAVMEGTKEGIKTDVEASGGSQSSSGALPIIAEGDAKPEEPTQESDISSSTLSEEVAGTVSSEESESLTDSTEDAPPGSVSIYTLRRGQYLTGTVKNITDFGAFIDLGIAQDGLVHISELARRKVEQVTEVVSQGQEVDVWVKKVDKKRGRISLTMIKPVKLKLKDIQEDSELEGVITRLEPYGAFVDIDSDRDGLVHISQITHEYIKHPEDVLSVGDNVNVKVLKVNRKKRQIDLSIKALLPEPQEEIKPVEEVEVVVPEPQAEETVTTAEEEPMPTAMAIAYAALQNEGQSDKDKTLDKNKKRRKKEMDDIIARTLATQKK
jgi:transcriptional accessory protein Tex/SPT6